MDEEYLIVRIANLETSIAAWNEETDAINIDRAMQEVILLRKMLRDYEDAVKKSIVDTSVRANL